MSTETLVIYFGITLLSFGLRIGSGSLQLNISHFASAEKGVADLDREVKE